MHSPNALYELVQSHVITGYNYVQLRKHVSDPRFSKSTLREPSNFATDESHQCVGVRSKGRSWFLQVAKSGTTVRLLTFASKHCVEVTLPFLTSSNLCWLVIENCGDSTILNSQAINSALLPKNSKRFINVQQMGYCF